MNLNLGTVVKMKSMLYIISYGYYNERVRIFIQFKNLIKSR